MSRVMILYFFITCIPFFLFYKSIFSLNPNLNRKSTRSEARLSLPCSSPLALLKDLIFTASDPNPPLKTMSPKRKASTTSKVESVEEDDDVSAPPLLELPELALDCILERLPPRALCSLAGVCSAMRERCVSDRLWERHMKSKWGRVLGRAARRDWECHVASRPRHDQLARQANSNKQQKGLLRLLSLGWPFSWIVTRPKPDSSSECNDATKLSSPLRADSVMAWYISLETGNFCFPAQVYNREVYIDLNVTFSFLFFCWVL